MGPIPPSRKLQTWLKTPGKVQVLITEEDCRNLDPIGSSTQFSEGFSYWVDKLLEGIPCLLYTSPSPRDRTRSRMPSSA